MAPTPKRDAAASPTMPSTPVRRSPRDHQPLQYYGLSFSGVPETATPSRRTDRLSGKMPTSNDNNLDNEMVDTPKKTPRLKINFKKTNSGPSQDDDDTAEVQSMTDVNTTPKTSDHDNAPIIRLKVPLKPNNKSIAITNKAERSSDNAIKPLPATSSPNRVQGSTDNDAKSQVTDRATQGQEFLGSDIKSAAATSTSQDQAFISGNAKSLAANGAIQTEGSVGHAHTVEKNQSSTGMRIVLEEQLFHPDIVGQRPLPALADRNVAILAEIRQMAEEQLHVGFEKDAAREVPPFGDATPGQVYTQEEVSKGIEIGTVFPRPPYNGEFLDVTTLVEAPIPGMDTHPSTKNRKGQTKQKIKLTAKDAIKSIQEKAEHSAWEEENHLEEYQCELNLNDRFVLPRTPKTLGGVMTYEGELPSTSEFMPIVQMPHDEVLVSTASSKVSGEEENTDYYGLAGIEYSAMSDNQKEMVLLQAMASTHGSDPEPMTDEEWMRGMDWINEMEG